MNRRTFFTGFTGLIALPAPSIVRAGSLMPIFRLDPPWIANHVNPIWGEFVVRMPNARLLDGFDGMIRPGDFYWRKDGRLYDICEYPRTHLRVTPGVLAVQNLDRGKLVPSERPGPRARIQYTGYEIIMS